MRAKIFSLEEEVRGARVREEAILVRIESSERRLEEARRWERSYRRRELLAEAASRIWEERVVVALRWEAEARRRAEEWRQEVREARGELESNGGNVEEEGIAL